MTTSCSGRWPRWADPAIAAAVTAAAVAELAQTPGSPPGQYAAAVVMGTALAWRRRAPVTVLLAVHAALLVHPVAGYDSNTLYIPLTLYPAYYNLGAHRDVRPSALGLVAGLGLMALVVRLEGLPFGEFAFPAIIAALAWGAGAGMRARIAAAVEADGRARLAEERQRHAAETAVADERARIARELHDVVAHSVSVMVMQAGALRRRLPPERQQDVGLARTIEATGREALVELRRMLGLLREDRADPVPLAPQPGLGRISDLVESTEAAGVPVTVTMEALPAPLPPGVDLCAYRIVQESLTNVIKHAGPARAEVGVRSTAGTLEVEVVDDGRGGPVTTDGGHGLIGMRERVALFGGALVAGPTPAGGFAVRATLPLELR